MSKKNTKLISTDEEFETTYEHIMSLAEGRIDTPGFWRCPLIISTESTAQRVEVTDSGQRKVKGKVKTVLKAVVRGDEATVGAAEADRDGIEIETGGWKDRHYEMVKYSEDSWNDLLRLLCEFTPDIDIQAVANIMDIDNHSVWEMPHNFSHYPGIMLDITVCKPLSWDPVHGFYFNRQVGVQDWGVPKSKAEMPSTRPERHQATEEGEMVVCHNPRDESHWEDYNFDPSKPNHEEYHYYKHEMIFASSQNNEETLEIAAATLPGVPREPWNEFHTRKEQERVRKKAEMEDFREFRKRSVLNDGERPGLPSF
ncbi:hypothetical protein BCON_0190g00120 [Botryotinia convoluta]|uniref:Uncharacterized protein n=1 Tax=Botryotinia convoluta TaxID=54673 RepID=A0A4Z1HU40_9HELO|nr:hypothetical protein BCON_0190g00120 [Botryotinia convoluta]